MNITYKRLTEKELNTFIDPASALKQYYMRHMADGTFVSWLAFDGDKIIGTSGMSVDKYPL